MRQRGWKVWQLDAEMALHDAAMTRFSQRWKRTRRGGYAAAEGMAMHGQPPEYHGVKTVLRATFWGGTPFSVAALTLAFGIPALLLVLAYPLQIARSAIRQGADRAAWEGALFSMLSKFAEFVGGIEYAIRAWLGRRAGIFEYK